VNAPAQGQRRSLQRPKLRREQLSEEVAAHLRAAIMSGTLRPGTFIRLDETAAQLGVSITPVREALLTLRGEGMVELEPHRGHVVVPLDRQDVEDIFWLQATIAKELARSTVERITDEEIDHLEEITTSLAAAVDGGDVDGVIAAEFAFHRALNHTSGRIKLSWFLLHVARYMPPRVYAGDPTWGAAAVEHHRSLITALRERNLPAVTELTEWQFTDGAARLTGMLEQTGIWEQTPDQGG
jgi:DNA-binding GntR family transcriptional regulator